MDRLRCGVIGVGYLGKFHAEKYKKLAGTHLVAVADSNEDSGKGVANKLGCDYVNNYLDILSLVDAVSIATPTSLHYDVAKACIEKGIHVLIEKPITSTVAQAKELISLSKKNKVKLQVGHIERYNPAVISMEDLIKKPFFIQASRLAIFNNRIKDANVVLDLMIHDIEIIRSWISSPISSISAVGSSVLSDDIDMASVRIDFEDGCVVDVMAHRASTRRERIMKIYQGHECFLMDLNNRMLSTIGDGQSSSHNITELDQMFFDGGDALLEEIKDFSDAIIFDRQPKVTGEMAMDALEIAERATTLIHTRNIKLFPNS